jgi:hypothetical protein
MRTAGTDSSAAVGTIQVCRPAGRPDLDVALKLGIEASKVCDRKIEVRPFL